MSQLEVDKIIPQSGTTLTIGDSGDTVNFADGTNLSIDTNTLFIDSTNNRVGIATNSPSETLEVSGNIKLGDNNKIKFGTGDDLQIFHDGSNSYVSDYGTGFLVVQTNGSGILFQNENGTEGLAKFLKDGAVELNYDNSKKFETTSGGVDVTGTVTLDNTLNISGGSTSGFLQASSTLLQFGASTSSNLVLYTNNAERMRITADGKVGIGTSSPSTSLHISQSQPIITLTDTDTSVSHQLSGQSGSSHFNLKVDTGGSSGSPVFNLSMQDNIKLSVLNDGNVGIGTTTPGRTLDVAGIVRSSTAFALGGNTSTPAEGSAIYRPASDNLAFVTNNNERARFDSSGRFLLAKTSTAIGDVGISLDSNGKISATRSSDPVFLLNRLSSDGTIADFRKDGTTVGSIFSRGGAVSGIILDPRAGGNGLLGQSGSICPVDETQTREDNATDLGRSDFRFKDLYLGGGAFIGGTGTANKLDDYEEGTFTPGFSASSCSFNYSQQHGFYTKIGRSVTCHIFIRAQSSGATSNQLFVSNFPFTSLNTTGLYSSASFGQLQSVDYSGGVDIVGHISPNSTQMSFQKTQDNNGALLLPASAIDGSTSSGFMISINYFTDA